MTESQEAVNADPRHAHGWRKRREPHMVGVQSLRLERGLTRRELAKRAGISSGAVFNAEMYPSVSERTVQRIVAALEVDYWDVCMPTRKPSERI